MKQQKGIFKYLNDRIWNVRLEDRNPWMAFLFKQLRILLIVTKNYTKDNLQLQAAGLTFYTVLSVVPLVALAFAISKGFGFQDALEEQLTESLSGHQEVVEQIMVFASRMLENTKGGLLAGVGVAILLWTVMRLLANIELSFNEIWQVPKGRSWIRKFTEYFSIMLLAPILIILAGSITVVISAEIENLVAGYDILQTIGPAIHFLIKMIPYTLVWLLFTFVYMVMPNTKVSFKSALIAGIIAGTAFQFVEWGYIHFQVGVSRYNAIYGSFAALPLFLVFVNISWLITLIGAEIAYANQHVTEIEHEVDGEKLSSTQKHVIALLILRQIASGFNRGEDPMSAAELVEKLDLPYGVTSKALDLLVEAHLLGVVEHNVQDMSRYLPARNIDQLTVAGAIDALDRVGYTEISKMDSHVFNQYFLHYSQMREAMQDSEKNVLVKDLPPIKLNP